MRDNLKRAGDAARWYYPLLMKFEWPVLLKIIGKGEGKDRYLSVADVRTLFNERAFPARIDQRIVSQPILSTCTLRFRWALGSVAALVALVLAAVVAVAEFPTRSALSCHRSSRRRCHRLCPNSRRRRQPIGSSKTGH